MHRTASEPTAWWRRRALRGALVWLVAAIAMVLLQTRLELAGLALLLVLAATLAALWWGPVASLVGCAMAIVAFNWSFVPPRGTLNVDLPQHALLLATMAAVSGTVALLMARQRALSRRTQALAARQAALLALGAALRTAPDTEAGLQRLREALGGCCGGPVALWRRGTAEAGDALALDDAADADECSGLRLCAELGQAFGPGTGRHEDQPSWFLPLRGRLGTAGAALLRRPLLDADDAEDDEVGASERREHAQALCDLVGQWLEHGAALARAEAEREAAQLQRLRNTLLAAIAHDARTPLATILGAATSLQTQAERLATAQREKLVGVIVDEVEQLGRLTDNTLQLARLGTPNVALQTDWESPEELVGSVLARVRRRDPARRLKARVEPGLPLLRCDAVLLVQLLENLIDNALRYSPADAPIELRAHRQGDHVVLAVRDRGPGVPLALRERIFEPFARGAAARAGDVGLPAERQRGAGVGLALCRAIAQVHGGELRLRPRAHGGSAFECWLPCADAPAAAWPSSD